MKRRSVAARRVWRRSWLFARLSREGRILFAAACLALPLAANISQGETHQLVVAALALLAASLLASRAYRPSGLVVEASSPPRVALGDDLCVALDLANDATRGPVCKRARGPEIGSASNPDAVGRDV